MPRINNSKILVNCIFREELLSSEEKDLKVNILGLSLLSQQVPIAAPQTFVGHVLNTNKSKLNEKCII